MTAVSTDLWFAAITKTAATKVHRGPSLIDWLKRKFRVGDARQFEGMQPVMTVVAGAMLGVCWLR